METYFIQERDLQNLVTGASFLGTGGGGDPYIGGLMLKRELELVKKIEVITGVKYSNSKSFVLGSAMMGAPIVMIEKIPSSSEAKKALEVYSKFSGNEVEYITPLEMGGVNSTIPLITSAKTGIPVIDGDGMGRAFPELQMTTFYFYGVQPSPIVIFDERGNVSIVQGIDGYWSEKIARVITVRYGGSAYIALYGTSLSTYSNTAVLGTLSLALEIGELLNQMRLDDVLDLLKAMIVFKGKVVDVQRRVEKGFSKGNVIIDGLENISEQTMKIDFQNEFLVARINNNIVTTVPDLITVLDLFTLKPITTDRIKYGQKVMVIGIPSSVRLRSKEALRYIGPRAFGYDVDFIPLEERWKKVEN
ncbi:protein of unknown function DUF917 [Sulfolobus islandicus L.S.2.15]|jgi:DUF917 family protein|uniref:DUF917 domain-containing protein n=3 Tax=Saccharolobus islandicus TaxID=43080 RepID=C3MP08_SACI2|nr:DUF917 domain-containing protein [Sulfolobus islandicus]ACP35121.1 protein of unknown function DUF917 [Sulfolobus islandicus L.S.2.15]ACP49236.1 protein of unknown function DUF917 [Sulfolobus islandicus Y.N.15.51]ADB86337.1 protein of unknown function DUF917 [Sulfolobus islandicus L.D.8.5]PVU77831.1 DUF917 domain-containing protein [Sulfolobus islandicus]